MTIDNLLSQIFVLVKRNLVVWSNIKAFDSFFRLSRTEWDTIALQMTPPSIVQQVRLNGGEWHGILWLDLETGFKIMVGGMIGQSQSL